MGYLRQKVGQHGEAVAAEYLKNKGYAILYQNWHAGRYGEIDLIAKDKDNLVIVEVKTRRQTAFGYPEEAVNKTKLDKLHRAAQIFCLKHPQIGTRYRLEAVALIIDEERRIINIKHYCNLNFDNRTQK